MASAGMAWLLAGWPPHASSRLACSVLMAEVGTKRAEVETHKHIFMPPLVTVYSCAIGQSKVGRKDVDTLSGVDTQRYHTIRVIDFNLPYQVQLNIMSKSLFQMFC